MGTVFLHSKDDAGFSEALNETYPDAKEEMVQLITDIKRLNEEKRNEQ